MDVAPALGRSGDIPRDDVALLVAEVLDVPGSAGVTFEALSGETPVAEAVRAL